MVVTNDLHVNRKFLDTNFQGYKLNSSPLSQTSLQIQGIETAHPSDEQYSFLQQREYSLHNHLHYDPWDTCTIYIISCNRKVEKVVTNKENGILDGPFCVWEVPFTKSRIDGHSNVTICFGSENIVVVSNGSGSLYILTTGDRKKASNSWKEVHCESVPDGIRLADARSPSPDQLHCLYCHVDTKQTYITHLHFQCDERGTWKLEHSAVMFGKGSVDYVALDPACKLAYVIGQIEVATQEYIDEEKQKMSEEAKEISFEWQQSYEDIKLWIDVTESNDPIVKVSTSEIHIKSPGGNTILHGIFHRPVEDGLTIWKFIQRGESQRTLEVVLSKRDEGSMWPQLFDTRDFRGKEIPDPDLAAEINSKLAHLTSETEDVGGATVLNSGQLEECDITDGEKRLLIYYDLTSPLTAPIKKVDLGNGQWLMIGPRSLKNPPLFCLRSDVDGIVWQINDKSVAHVATLCAFGFIQASKASRIFSFLPADANYGGLVDTDGRVFIYCRGVRPKDKTDWGSQHLVTLGKTKILGVHATSSNIYVLSENELHLIQLN